MYKSRIERLAAFLILSAILMWQPHSVYAAVSEQQSVSEQISEQEEIQEKNDGNETPTEVTDLDMGEYQSEMEAGATQLLVITPIPQTASSQEYKFSSDNTSVATINGIGRITAVSPGQSVITVECQKVVRTFDLSVTEKQSDEIAVSDIEIVEHEEELEVGKTMSLSATVFPENATKPQVIYTSSNPEIAAVNPAGEVKGISSGSAVIIVSAGTIKKEVTLIVKVMTKQIKLSRTYLVLKPGEEYQLSAAVIPAEANQGISYKAADSEIAAVTADGSITAVNPGNTTIMVSNEDISTAVTVIVNEKEQQTVKGEEDTKGDPKVKEYPAEVSVKEYPVISRKMLKHLYKKEKSLKIQGTGYTIEIQGREIVNYNNELKAEIILKKENKGMSFQLNQGGNLCGPVKIVLDKNKVRGKYLYLYNNSKRRYEMIQAGNMDRLYLDSAGKYLIAQEKIDRFRLPAAGLGIAGIGTAGLGITYIFMKRKYWFW